MNDTIKLVREVKKNKNGKEFNVYFLMLPTSKGTYVKCEIPLEFVYGKKDDSNPKKFKGYRLLNNALGDYCKVNFDSND